ncbi:MAG: hypothetical protein HQL29_04055 [Candidatus Omnitrophica bacterium]|nr:hypothetical protein [Candidatus Omnitrophota bacterium]
MKKNIFIKIIAIAVVCTLLSQDIVNAEGLSRLRQRNNLQPQLFSAPIDSVVMKHESYIKYALQYILNSLVKDIDHDGRRIFDHKLAPGFGFVFDFREDPKNEYNGKRREGDNWIIPCAVGAIDEIIMNRSYKWPYEAIVNKDKEILSIRIKGEKKEIQLYKNKDREIRKLFFISILAGSRVLSVKEAKKLLESAKEWDIEQAKKYNITPDLLKDVKKLRTFAYNTVYKDMEALHKVSSRSYGGKNYYYKSNAFKTLEQIDLAINDANKSIKQSEAEDLQIIEEKVVISAPSVNGQPKREEEFIHSNFFAKLRKYFRIENIKYAWKYILGSSERRRQTQKVLFYKKGIEYLGDKFIDSAISCMSAEEDKGINGVDAFFDSLKNDSVRGLLIALKKLGMNDELLGRIYDPIYSSSIIANNIPAEIIERAINLKKFNITITPELLTYQKEIIAKRAGLLAYYGIPADENTILIEEDNIVNFAIEVNINAVIQSTRSNIEERESVGLFLFRLSQGDNKTKDLLSSALEKLNEVDREDINEIIDAEFSEFNMSKVGLQAVKMYLWAKTEEDRRELIGILKKTAKSLKYNFYNNEMGRYFESDPDNFVLRISGINPTSYMMTGKIRREDKKTFEDCLYALKVRFPGLKAYSRASFEDAQTVPSRAWEKIKDRINYISNLVYVPWLNRMPGYARILFACMFLVVFLLPIIAAATVTINSTNDDGIISADNLDFQIFQNLEVSPAAELDVYIDQKVPLFESGYNAGIELANLNTASGYISAAEIALQIIARDKHYSWNQTRKAGNLLSKAIKGLKKIGKEAWEQNGERLENDARSFYNGQRNPVDIARVMSYSPIDATAFSKRQEQRHDEVLNMQTQEEILIPLLVDNIQNGGEILPEITEIGLSDILDKVLKDSYDIKEAERRLKLAGLRKELASYGTYFWDMGLSYGSVDGGVGNGRIESVVDKADELRLRSELGVVLYDADKKNRESSSFAEEKRSKYYMERTKINVAGELIETYSKAVISKEKIEILENYRSELIAIKNSSVYTRIDSEEIAVLNMSIAEVDSDIRYENRVLEAAKSKIRYVAGYEADAEININRSELSLSNLSEEIKRREIDRYFTLSLAEKEEETRAFKALAEKRLNIKIRGLWEEDVLRRFLYGDIANPSFLGIKAEIIFGDTARAKSNREALLLYYTAKDEYEMMKKNNKNDMNIKVSEREQLIQSNDGQMGVLNELEEEAVDIAERHEKGLERTRPLLRVLREKKDAKIKSAEISGQIVVAEIGLAKTFEDKDEEIKGPSIDNATEPEKQYTNEEKEFIEGLISYIERYLSPHERILLKELAEEFEEGNMRKGIFRRKLKTKEEMIMIIDRISDLLPVVNVPREGLDKHERISIMDSKISQVRSSLKNAGYTVDTRLLKDMFFVVIERGRISKEQIDVQIAENRSRLDTKAFRPVIGVGVSVGISGDITDLSSNVFKGSKILKNAGMGITGDLPVYRPSDKVREKAGLEFVLEARIKENIAGRKIKENLVRKMVRIHSINEHIKNLKDSDKLVDERIDQLKDRLDVPYSSIKRLKRQRSEIAIEISLAESEHYTAKLDLRGYLVLDDNETMLLDNITSGDIDRIVASLKEEMDGNLVLSSEIGIIPPGTLMAINQEGELAADNVLTGYRIKSLKELKVVTLRNDDGTYRGEVVFDKGNMLSSDIADIDEKKIEDLSSKEVSFRYMVSLSDKDGLDAGNIIIDKKTGKDALDEGIQKAGRRAHVLTSYALEKDGDCFSIKFSVSPLAVAGTYASVYPALPDSWLDWSALGYLNIPGYLTGAHKRQKERHILANISMMEAKRYDIMLEKTKKIADAQKVSAIKLFRLTKEKLGITTGALAKCDKELERLIKWQKELRDRDALSGLESRKRLLEETKDNIENEMLNINILLSVLGVQESDVSEQENDHDKDPGIYRGASLEEELSNVDINIAKEREKLASLAGMFSSTVKAGGKIYKDQTYGSDRKEGAFFTGISLNYRPNPYAGEISRLDVNNAQNLAGLSLEEAENRAIELYGKYNEALAVMSSAEARIDVTSNISNSGDKTQNTYNKSANEIETDMVELDIARKNIIDAKQNLIEALKEFSIAIETGTGVILPPSVLLPYDIDPEELDKEFMSKADFSSDKVIKNLRNDREISELKEKMVFWRLFPEMSGQSEWNNVRRDMNILCKASTRILGNGRSIKEGIEKLKQKGSEEAEKHRISELIYEWEIIIADLNLYLQEVKSIEVELKNLKIVYI